MGLEGTALGPFGDRTLIEALNAVVAGDPADPDIGSLTQQFAIMDRDQRETSLRKVITAYGRAARYVILNEHPEILAEANRRNQQQGPEEDLSVGRPPPPEPFGGAGLTLQ
jgi:hypothetical protein